MHARIRVRVSVHSDTVLSGIELSMGTGGDARIKIIE